jgi:hypothetical protein
VRSGLPPGAHFLLVTFLCASKEKQLARAGRNPHISAKHQKEKNGSRLSPGRRGIFTFS